MCGLLDNVWLAHWAVTVAVSGASRLFLGRSSKVIAWPCTRSVSEWRASPGRHGQWWLIHVCTTLYLNKKFTLFYFGDKILNCKPVQIIFGRNIIIIIIVSYHKHLPINQNSSAPHVTNTIVTSGVTRGWGQTSPGDTLQGMTLI